MLLRILTELPIPSRGYEVQFQSPKANQSSSIRLEEQKRMKETRGPYGQEFNHTISAEFCRV